MAYYEEVSIIAFGFNQISLESKADLVIGIDFGTTFTGVAFALAAKATGDDLIKIADEIQVIKKWPTTRGSTLEKTNTILSYHTNPPTYGAMVKTRDEPQVSYFKLGLQPGVGSHYQLGSMHNPRSALPFLDPNWKHPQLPNKTAVDFAADYLTCIHNFVKQTYFPTEFGPVFLQNQQISYVITVPAIWKDSAKALTRQAAIRAGIPDKRLELITEPEAAALYCATKCAEVDLNDGEYFLICDAGGGTVDLIAYEIMTRSPFEIQEANIGSGAACGATYLNRGFESLLRRKLGDQAVKILSPKRLREALRYFENDVKAAFNPMDPNCEAEFDVPIPGVEDDDSLGISEGFLKISKSDMESFYKPIFERIYDLVKKQITDVGKKGNKIKTMFLVGGLGTNKYLYQFLSQRLGREIDVKQPESGYSAIMKGAVLHKLGLNFVKERMMRRNYGVSFNRNPFKPGDPAERKGTNLRGESICRGAMRWYATKMQRVPNGQGVKFTFATLYSEEDYNTPGPLIANASLSVCEDDSPPDYEIDTVSDLCSLNVDVSSLKPLQRQYGKSGPYYEVVYELAVNFGPELLFGLVHKGRVMGQVAARYN